MEKDYVINIELNDLGVLTPTINIKENYRLKPLIL